jgi:membrane associated rhomboid family serine protease
MSILGAMAFTERRVSYGGRMMGQMTPVVKWLLILNLGIFFGDLLLFDWKIRNGFAFTIKSALFEFRIWEFISFQFLHSNVGHVLSNCIGLFFFGPWMERWWGAKKFLLFYLVCGVAGAAFYCSLVFAGILPQTILGTFPDGTRMEFPAALVPLMGASAGVYGILVGVAVIAPAMRVSLFLLPFTFTMRQLALGLLLIAAGAVILKIGGNEGGEAGHLGGAIMGYFMMKSRGWMGWIHGATKKRNGRPPSDFTPKIRPRTIVDLHGQSEVDEILEKISRDGFQSLTKKERDVLHKAAKSAEKQGL